jgi:hypothetical protein
MGDSQMNSKLARARIALVLSAFVGGFTCTLADLMQKSEASAVLLIGQKLNEIFGVPSPTLFAIGIILILAAALPLIFESPTKKGAFYAGASVLAILMTITPYNVPPGLKTESNSVEVNLSISTQDKRRVEGAVVTLWDASGRTVKARSRPPGSQLRFFQDGGTYRLTVELPGYKTESRSLSLREGSPPQSLSITLQPSSTPLFIQRIIR